MNTDFAWEMEDIDLSAEFEGDEELNRLRRSFARPISPRTRAPRPTTQRSRSRPAPSRRPPIRSRRIHLHAPESPAASEHVRWVQTMLNQALNLQLPVDGVMNVQTRSAIRSFQEQRGLPVTGVVGPDTERALLASRDGQSSGAAAPPGEPSVSPDEPAPSNSADPASASPAAEFYFPWEAMMDDLAPEFEAESSTCPPFAPVAVEKRGGDRIEDTTIPSRADLVVIQGAFAKTPLHRLAAEALKALVCAARADRIKPPLLLPTGSRSGFRNPEMQKAAWERALVKYKTEAEARKWVARPGFSPHQTGRAVDLYLGVPNDSANVAKLRRTPAYKWMVANAHRFGFYPYAREPWHWEYNPPASGGSEVSYAWEVESEWEDEAALDILSPTELKAVKITSTFETGRPGGFGGLTGNFDGQGISFGLMNFAFRAGSLPPLLQEFITKHPDRYAATFGKDAVRFKEIVFATKVDPSNPKRRVRDVERQMDFVNTQMNQYPRKAKGNKIVEPWKTYFGRLENDPVFRKIQVKAVRRALGRARDWYKYFEFKTERGFAFMFDLVSSHGGAWLNAPKFKGKRSALLQKMLGAKKTELGRNVLTEREKMEVIANMIADVSLHEWREKVRVRKLWFVKGSGKVHGHAWDIRKDFGVTDDAPDFGPAGSQVFEWEVGQDSEEFEDEQPGVASAPSLLGDCEKHAEGETCYVKIGLGKGLPAATGIYIPNHLNPNSDVSILVYLHGHKSAYPGNNVLIKGYWDGARFPFFALREEVAASRKNVIFVAPSLGATSQAGTLVQKGGFDAFMEKVVASINAHYLRPRGMRLLADVQTVILAAHSGGGSPMLRIAAGTDRYARKIMECWGFDSMYGGVAASWLEWARSHPNQRLYAYFGAAKGYRNTQGRFIASPRDNAETIACTARRQKVTNVCMQPSRARTTGKVHAHFWVPKVHLGERLQNHPCSDSNICPEGRPRRQTELDVSSEIGTDWWSVDEVAWEGEVNRGSADYIKWVQRSLNQILGLQLAVDGISGTNTRSAIRSFQARQYGLKVDGIVGANTEAALIRAGASVPTGSTGAPSASPGGGTPTTPLLVNTPLPASGPGFYSYTSADKRYGTSATIKAVQTIATAWNQAHPAGPRLGIGNISRQGGGAFPPHSTHREGLNVDIRPVRSDRGESPVRYTDSHYSRSLTQELVNHIHANPVLGVSSILFNDTGIQGVKPYKGHDDHLHVTFIAGAPADRPTSAPASDALPAAWSNGPVPPPVWRPTMVRYESITCGSREIPANLRPESVTQGWTARTQAIVNVIRGPRFGWKNVEGGATGTQTGHVSGSYHYCGRAIDSFAPGVLWNTRATGAGLRASWCLANWAAHNAAALNVSEVIFYDHIWTVAKGGWRPYTNPDILQKPNYENSLQHRDHVHISVY